MGIDMKPQSIEARIAQHNLGPLGYGFVVDNNGQLIVHPLIDRNYTKKLSSDDLISLDVSDFEHTYNESDFESVRQAVIDRNTGNQSLAVWLPVERERRYLLKNASYFYAPVEGTPFSVAIVLTSDGVDVFQYPNVTMAMVKELSAWEINGDVYLDGRPYCGDVWAADPVVDARGFLTDLIQELVGGGAAGTRLDNCNPSLYLPLLSDLYYVKLLVEEAEEEEREEEEKDGAASDGLVIQFSSGLTWCSGGFQCSQLQLIPLTGEGGSDLLLYPDPSGAVVAVRPLHVAIADSSALIGVVGIVLSNQTIRDVLENATSPYNEILSSSGSDNDGFVFYLLDSNGYIMSSTSSQDKFGESMASIQPEVFRQLVEEGVFISAIITGYELKPCQLEQNLETGPCKESDASSLHHGLLIALLAWVRWALTGGLWAAVRLMTLSFLSSILSFTGWSVSGAGEAGGSCPVDLCLQQTVVYQLQEMSSGLNGSVNCTDGRTLEYRAAPLPRTNMLLVAINGTCNSTSPEEDNLQSQYRRPCPCNCTECGRYRRLPPQSVCYDNATSFVPNSQCSRAASIDLDSTYVYVAIATLIITVLLEPAS